nr:Protein K01A11.1 [Haemonchus contortus]
MRLTALVILFMTAMLVDCTPRTTDLPSGSSDSVLSGFERVRLRAHRRRHRHKTINLEADEMFEMFGDQLHRNQHRTRKNKSATSVKKRERNEDLCAMERRTIDLNTMGDEFDPPFLVEVRCQNTANYERGTTDTLVEQTCVHNLLRCVQRYGEVIF